MSEQAGTAKYKVSLCAWDPWALRHAYVPSIRSPEAPVSVRHHPWGVWEATSVSYSHLSLPEGGLALLVLIDSSSLLVTGISNIRFQCHKESSSKPIKSLKVHLMLSSCHNFFLLDPLSL